MRMSFKVQRFEFGEMVLWFEYPDSPPGRPAYTNTPLRYDELVTEHGVGQSLLY